MEVEKSDLQENTEASTCKKFQKELKKMYSPFKILPILTWGQKYTPSLFIRDIIAGLTVGLLVIPQSMAYSQLAGLPSQYGLYSSFMAPMLRVTQEYIQKKLYHLKFFHQVLLKFCFI